MRAKIKLYSLNLQLNIKILEMKNIKKCLALVAFLALFSSCSDTIVNVGAENEGPVNDSLTSGYFTKRVLIEDYTGTWCGNCTRVALAIENVLIKTDRAEIVAIHNGDDPYHFAGITPLANLIYPGQADLPLPTARLNRTIKWKFPETSNIQQAVDLTGYNCGLGLAVNSNMSGQNIDLNVKVKFAEDYQNLRLVVYVLEDNLNYFQVNYTASYYGGQNPIPNYDHDNVVRATVTDILGDSMGTSFAAGTTFERSFSVNIPANVENASNIRFVAFVVGDDNKAINVRSASVNQSQALEQNP